MLICRGFTSDTADATAMRSVSRLCPKRVEVENKEELLPRSIGR